MKKHIFGKKFIAGLAFSVVVVLCLLVFGPTVAQPGQEAHVGQILQVITADPQHERTIAWKTKDLNSPGIIEIRPKGSENVTRIAVRPTELPAGKGGNPAKLYSAHISGLAPGSEYEYRLGVSKRQTAWRTFTTPTASAPFKALVFGDSQSTDYGEWARTAQAAWQNHRDAAFFIIIGDLVDMGADTKQWDAWIDGASDLLASVPVAPVMGNHEAYGFDWKMALPEYYLTLFSLPQNGPPGLEDYAYSFDYGDVHFVVLNTLIKELRTWYPDLIGWQKAWLTQDLAQTKKKWKVVLMHHGLWQIAPDAPLNELGKAFVPVFDEFNVDLVLMGHVHSYSRTKALKNNSPDPGGTVYITTGRSGTKVWDKSPRKPFDECFYNPLDMPNYLVFEAAQNALNVSAYKQSGELIDKVVIKK